MFNFTKAEIRALLITVFILLISGIYQLISPGKSLQPQIDYSESDSVFKRLSNDETVIQGDTLNSTSETGENTNKPATKKKSTYNKVVKEKLLPASININTASEKELQKLPRIGPAMAKRIVEYRNSHGKYKTIDELLNVKGIGKKTLEKLKPYITII